MRSPVVTSVITLTSSVMVSPESGLTLYVLRTNSQQVQVAADQRKKRGHSYFPTCLEQGICVKRAIVKLRAGLGRNSRIARGVRQTRNVTYEKPDPAKIFFARFPLEIERF